MATSGEPSPILPAPPRPPFLEWLCAGLVLVLAFLLASFPARNSDVWMHLATGRALAEGTYRFGADPFAHTTADVPWVNHSWLWDLLSYGVFRGLGPDALVVLKALLVAALAGVMLCIAWRGAHRWSAFFCVALAVLALSPYLELRPACVSYLLLGLTLWWLERPCPASDRRRTLLRCLPLPLLFALWTNLDDWFLLGPFAVTLYLLGAVAQRTLGKRREAVPPERIAAYALTLALGLAACLLNPYHVRTFTLPAALELPIFGEPHEGPGVAVFWAAYVPLIGLALVSFLVNGAALRWPRALLCLALLLLNAYGGEAAAFFAVVAGPLTALNLQEYFARRGRAHSPTGVTGAVAVALAGLALAAWPGWLGTAPAEPRRWAVEVDPSLAQTAAQLERWHAEGRVGAEAHAFNLSPVAANVFAWHCPKERGFLDSRANLFPAAVAADFHTVRQALLGPSAGLTGQPAGDWRGALRRAKVTHLILYDPTSKDWIAALRTVFAAPREWSPVALHGRTAVFAWRDPQAPGKANAFRVPALDLRTWAFHPPADKKAPAVGPGREPEPRTWWEGFWKPRSQPNVNRDEALAHLLRFDAGQPAWLRTRAALWEAALAAAAVGTRVPGSFPAAWGVQLPLLDTTLRPRPPGPPERYPPLARLTFEFISRYLDASDDGPVDALLSAVRAARRALRADPDDAFTHLWLGQAYVRLLGHTRERAAVRTFPLLDRFRKVQAVTALAHAVRLDRDLLLAHEALAGLYQQAGSLDLELAHRQEQLRCLRAAGRKGAETAEQFARRVQLFEERVEQLAKRYREALNLYETRAFGRDDLGRARAALEGGLTARALKILNDSRYEAFGVQGALLQLELFLGTGRVKEVREWMEPDQESKMGRANYRRLQATLAAATGNYAQADQDLRLLVVDGIDAFGLKKVPLRGLMALLAGESVLQNVPGLPLVAVESFPRPLLRARADQSPFLGGMRVLALGLREQGELAALRGLLALEAGETAEARARFRESLALWDADTEGAPALARSLLPLLEY